MAQTIKFNLIHKSLHGVLLRSETTRNFPPKDDIRIMVNLRPFWNSYSRKVSRTCDVQQIPTHQSLPSVPTFSSALKSFSKVTVILVNCKFSKHHFSLFRPQNDALSWKCFLLACRKPTKCKLATPEVIRCKPGNNFARAIHNCTCCALFRCLTTLRNSLRWCQDKKTKRGLLLHEYNYNRCSLEGITWKEIKCVGTGAHQMGSW